MYRRHIIFRIKEIIYLLKIIYIRSNMKSGTLKWSHFQFSFAPMLTFYGLWWTFIVFRLKHQKQQKQHILNLILLIKDSFWTCCQIAECCKSWETNQRILWFLFCFCLIRMKCDEAVKLLSLMGKRNLNSEGALLCMARELKREDHPHSSCLNVWSIY